MIVWSEQHETDKSCSGKTTSRKPEAFTELLKVLKGFKTRQAESHKIRRKFKEYDVVGLTNVVLLKKMENTHLTKI